MSHSSSTSKSKCSCKKKKKKKSQVNWVLFACMDGWLHQDKQPRHRSKGGEIKINKKICKGGTSVIFARIHLDGGHQSAFTYILVRNAISSISQLLNLPTCIYAQTNRQDCTVIVQKELQRYDTQKCSGSFIWRSVITSVILSNDYPHSHVATLYPFTSVCLSFYFCLFL